MILKDKKVKDEFLGNRDFYYLIKGIAYDMESKNDEDLIRKNIERNFGGLEIIIDFEKDYSSIDEFSNFDSKGHEFRTFVDELVKLTKNKENPKKISSVEIFKMIYKFYVKDNTDFTKESPYINNILDNLKDTKSRSRYLLMEIEPSLSSLIHQKLSKELKKKIYFYEGSPFVYDYSNEYQYQMIKKIKEHANNGDIIILQNLNQIYAFLYDLFNKNFTLKDGKKYARICHGNYTDQYFPVNNEFRVIVMVNKQYLDKVEPPFLNRFEKIIISFDKLINENKPSDILGQLDDIYYNEKCYYSLKDLLIGCSEEDVFGMIYYELNTNENQKQNIDKKIYLIKYINYYLKI